MTKAMEIYEAVKEHLGNEIKLSRGMSKREFTEDGWTYTFFFNNDKLMKIEAYNKREFIEIWNK